MDKMKLTAENVNTILIDCLYKNDEDTTNHVKASGVKLNIIFNPNKLKEHKQKIEDMLNQLPDQFHKNKGGGWSFLHACRTNKGVQWGNHSNIDELLCLGIAIEKAEIQLPREMWKSFPGEMPYITIN